jgi:hypothetical protein
MTEQYFKEQAIRAERLARAIIDERTREALMGLARDYWEKAGSLTGEYVVKYGSTAAKSLSPNAGVDNRISTHDCRGCFS